MKALLKISILLALYCCVDAAFAKNLSSITLNPPVTGSGLTTSTGTIQLTPVCGYDDNTTDNCTASGITLTWYSDTPANAPVNSSGLVTGAGATSSYVSATIVAYSTSAWTGAQNGYVYGRHQVRFNYSPTTLGITTGFANKTALTVGSTGEVSAFDNFTASFYQGGASPACAWTSASPSIATVNNRGEVTGVSAGAAVISCKIEALTANFTINVSNPTLDSNTYYTRTAGSNTNCSGLVNVDDPGTGTLPRACAWSTPEHMSATMGSGSTGIVQQASFTLSADIAPPSGTPAHPTKFYAACVPSCTTDPYSVGNRTVLITPAVDGITIGATQNVDIEGFDETTGQECNSDSVTWFPNPCPSGTRLRGVWIDQLTGQNTFRYMRIHGYMDGVTGTQGPGNQWLDSALVQNYHTGFNADDPFGQLGVIADGNTFTRVTVDTSGYVDVLPRNLSALARDGSGNLNVTFAPGSIVKYAPATKIVVQNASPSDLNGTYTVSSVNFNQQSVTITGGTIAAQSESGGSILLATFNTTTSPTFAAGAFVHIAGATPSFLNGNWAVSSATTDLFTINVSTFTHPTWTTGTISSGGTAATSLSLVAAAVGSAESATTAGQATFVRPASLGCDQGTAGVCNGDAWGGGFDTSGVWSFTDTSCSFNLQDCHDNLHGEIISDTVNKLFSYGNEGAAIKVGVADAVSVTNAQLGATCAVNLAANPDFPADYNQFISMPCRAQDALLVQERPWGNYVFSNLTWESTQNVGIDDICSNGNCSTPLPMARFIMQNLLFNCFQDSNNPTQSAAPAIYFPEFPGLGGPNAVWSWNNNMANGCRNPPTGGANNHWTTDPLVTLAVPTITTLAAESNALSWNMQLTGTSPALSAGLHNAYTPTLDYAGATRPNPPSIGAFELGGTPTVPTPTASPVAGTYSSPRNVTLSDINPSAVICYTVTGATPTATVAGTCDGAPTQTYATPIAVASTTTIKAIGTLAANLNSAVFSGLYTITPAAATPTFSPLAGTYTSTQSVTLSTISSGAIICYTTNGTTPATNGTTGCTTGSLYSTAISVSISQTVNAIAGGSGYRDSAVGSAAYVIAPFAGTPTFSPAAGTYTGTQSVTISTTTTAATLCYTTDGTTPTANGAGTCTHGTTYSTPVSVASSLAVKAVASKSGFTDSVAGSADYVIVAGTPTFSPVAGTYTGTQSVTISTSTAGATICYTSDGTAPTANGAGTCTHGTTYSAPVSVLTSETLKAIASKSGLTDSTVGSAVYVILAATPTFSPAAGTYTSVQSVTISTVTSGATLCYTSDGTTPTADGAGTCTHGTTYSGAVSVAVSETLKAVASKSGINDSAVGSAAYVINIPVVATPTASPAGGTYTGTQTVTLSTTTTGATICYTSDGTAPTANGAGTCTHGTTYSAPVSVSTSETLKAVASKSGLSDSSVGSAAYVIVAVAPTFSPVAGTYTSVQSVTISTVTSGATLCYTSDGTTPTANGAGTCTHGTTYSAPVSVASSLTLRAIASKSGINDSAVGSAAYVINIPVVATPTASPAGAVYTVTPQTVTLSTTTAAATICYTLDGSSPAAATPGTCSAGLTYSTPLSIATTTTLKMLGTKAAFTNSSIDTERYTIIPPGSVTTITGGFTITGPATIQ